MASSCMDCGGRVVDAYQLPGGDVVHADDVSFSDGPRGVTATRVCRKCGTEMEDNDGE